MVKAGTISRAMHSVVQNLREISGSRAKSRKLYSFVARTIASECKYRSFVHPLSVTGDYRATNVSVLYAIIYVIIYVIIYIGYVLYLRK